MKGAIVGCGVIASVHAKALSLLEDASLVACADIVPKRAEALAQEYGCRAYTSLDAMLSAETIDILHICAPHALHAEMATAAAARGVAVLTEKPPVTTLEQWAQMRCAAERVRVGVCFQNRFNPSVRHVQETLASGRLGRVLGARAIVTWARDAAYYADSGWRGTWALEGGSVLMNQSVHTLDLLVHLLGHPTSWQVHMANRSLRGVIQTEDTVEASIDFGPVRALLYATTAYCQDAPVLLELVCEQATVRIEHRAEAFDLEYRWRDGTLEKPMLRVSPVLGKGCYGSGHFECIRAFYTAVQRGEPFAIDLNRTEDTMRTIIGMYADAHFGN